jgi:hypothetical protein
MIYWFTDWLQAVPLFLFQVLRYPRDGPLPALHALRLLGLCPGAVLTVISLCSVNSKFCQNSSAEFCVTSAQPEALVTGTIRCWLIDTCVARCCIRCWSIDLLCAQGAAYAVGWLICCVLQGSAYAVDWLICRVFVVGTVLHTPIIFFYLRVAYAVHWLICLFARCSVRGWLINFICVC